MVTRPRGAELGSQWTWPNLRRSNEVKEDPLVLNHQHLVNNGIAVTCQGVKEAQQEQQELRQAVGEK